MAAPLDSYLQSVLVGSIGSYLSVLSVWMVFKVAQSSEESGNERGKVEEERSPRFMGQRRRVDRAS